MPHLTQEQIESANRVDLAGFLLSHGERLKSMGSQKLWEKHQVWVDGYRWYSHEGVIAVKCRKCKFNGPLDLAYFRTVKGARHRRRKP